jgi:hypothetical protein
MDKLAALEKNFQVGPLHQSVARYSWNDLDILLPALCTTAVENSITYLEPILAPEVLAILGEMPLVRAPRLPRSTMNTADHAVDQVDC